MFYHLHSNRFGDGAKRLSVSVATFVNNSPTFISNKFVTIEYNSFLVFEVNSVSPKRIWIRWMWIQRTIEFHLPICRSRAGLAIWSTDKTLVQGASAPQPAQPSELGQDEPPRDAVATARSH